MYQLSMCPHDLLVTNFWLHVILMHIWDLALPRPYAFLWSFYSWDHSLHHGWDQVSLKPIASGQFCNRNHTGCIAIVQLLRAVPYGAPMFLGCHALMYAQHILPWVGSLAWPQVDLGLISQWKKFIGILKCSWCSIGLDHESQINLLPVQRFLLYSPC